MPKVWDKGGFLFFKEWDQTKIETTEGSARQYHAKMRSVLREFECGLIDNFYTDKLLWLVEVGQEFPDLNLYLKTSKNPHDKLVACKAYLHLGSFMRDLFSQRYNNGRPMPQ